MESLNQISDNILETLRILRDRPLMIIAKDDSYVFLQNYIEGYIDGLSHCLNKNMRQEITKWYKAKFDTETSYYWTSHIPFQFSGETDDELKKKLLDITEEYFKKNKLY